MTTTQEEQQVLVRGSAEYREYMYHQAGWLKAVVNGLEDYLSISGRSLLLLFLIYTTIKAGMTIMHADTPVWLDIIMLTLQVAGLEGSVPGLTRVREALLVQNRPADARTIKRAIYSSRTLSVLTGIEIVLATASIPGIDPTTMAGIDDWYNKILLLIRLFVITSFLVAMARMETKAPKVISQDEHRKQQHEAEQEQVRLDNESIQSSIGQALAIWTAAQERKLATWTEQLAEAIQQTQATRLDERMTEAMDIFQACLDRSVAEIAESVAESSGQLWSVVQPLQDRLAALSSVDLDQRIVDALAQATDGMTASIFASLRQESEAAKRKNEAPKHLGEALLSAQSEGPKRSSEAEKRSTGALKRSSEAVPLLRLPSNTDRAAQKAEALRLIDQEQLSTYKAAERTGIPSGTIQRWLSERAKAEEARRSTEAREA